MKYIILLAVLLFFGKELSSQTTWGKVSPEQFAVKVCPFDTSANAVILMDSGSTTITFDGHRFSSEMHVYERIHILNKNGFDRASVTISYSAAFSNPEMITELEAQTLNLNEAGRVKISKVKDEEIFDEQKVRGVSSVKRFAFPDVKEGSIIEYRYTIINKASVSLNEWLFQSDIPVVRSAIKVKIPEVLQYAIHYQGNLPLIKSNIEKYRDIANDMSGIKVHYAMNDIPAYRREPYMSNVNNYICKIIFRVQGIKNTIAPYNVLANTLAAQMSRNLFPHTWPDVASSLMKAQKQATINNVAWTFYAQQLCKDQTNATGKVKAIYDQIHSIMKWNKTYGAIPAGTDSTGNTARINLIFMNMLRSVGVNADPVFISTIEHGKIDTTFPGPTEFNSLIVIADTGEHTMLLDASNPNKPWNLLTENDLNRIGMRVSTTKTDTTDVYITSWVEIRPAKTPALVISATMNVDTAGDIKSQQAFYASDYEALNFRDRPTTKTMDDVIKKRLSFSDGFEIMDQKIENEFDVDKKLKITFALQKKAGDADSKYIYVNPFPVRFYADNPLKESQRIYPVEFSYPAQRIINVTITIPENYKVSEISKAKKLVLQDGSASFTFLVAQSDADVQLSAVFKINNDVYQTDMYEDLQSLYAKMIDAMNSTIVLEKK